MEKKITKQQEYLTLPETAKYLRISMRHLYNLRNKGEIEFYDFGGAQRVSSAYLEKWIKERKAS